MSKHDEQVFAALALHRNVGATSRDVRQRVRWREKRKSSVKNDRASLQRLQRAGEVVQVGERFFLTTKGAKRAKGDAIAPSWADHDALVLLSTFSPPGGEGADLSQIMGAADYIDRSYPTLEQLHGSLNRLASARLITRRRGRFVVTDRARELADKAKTCGQRGIRGQCRALGRLLVCPCCGVRLKKVRWSIVIDQVMVDEAIKAYLERF